MLFAIYVLTINLFYFDHWVTTFLAVIYLYRNTFHKKLADDDIMNAEIEFAESYLLWKRYQLQAEMKYVLEI